MLDEFLARHPDCRRFEAYVVDTNGVWRGKWLDTHSVAKLFEGKLKLPLSTLALDVWGNDIAELVFEHGDRDGVLSPVRNGIRPVPWATIPTAQVQTRMLELDGQPFDGDPRNVLSCALDALAARGLTPVVAVELEFYLVQRDPAGSPMPAASRGPAPTTVHGREVWGGQTYGIESLAGFEPVLSDIEAACRLQDLPWQACLKESAPGQLEINLEHRPDALAAADEACSLKRTVKEMASRRGFDATFMAKPFAELAGSGQHVHVSLADERGTNVFADGTARGTARLRQAVAGLCASMPEAMAILAPNLNSLRRFQPGRHAPTRATWGYENRTTAIRIPAGDPGAIRIEHRVAGADANPYLVLAAVVAGIALGLDEALEPPAPITGNAYEVEGPALPRSWRAALERFERSDVMSRYLGEDFRRRFAATKRQELETFAARVTPFELETFLSLA